VREIPNEDLRVSDAPPDDASCEEIARFALTFDGYAYWGSSEGCAWEANERRHGTLAELRTCLFFEQRRWRHFGDEPDRDALNYMQSLVTSTRHKISGGGMPARCGLFFGTHFIGCRSR